jgi:hypothetical protein
LIELKMSAVVVAAQVDAEQPDEPTEASMDIRSDGRDDGDRRLPDL